MKVVNFLVKYRKYKIFFVLLKILGIELPSKVEIGKELVFPHLGGSIVIHPNCSIGNNVMIFQGVTIGRANPWITKGDLKMGKIYIGNGVCLCAGAKILCSENDMYIGDNTIIAANAVLTKSTGNNEIWGGIPARKLKSSNE